MSVELEGDISTSTNSFIRNERTVAEEELEQQIRVKQESFQTHNTVRQTLVLTEAFFEMLKRLTLVAVE